MSKPKLIKKAETRFFVDVDDFNRFVEECYGGSFEFMAIQEADFNTSYSFSAPNANMDFGGEVENKIKNSEYPNYCVHALFNILYKDGLIEKGEYMIKIEH